MRVAIAVVVLVSSACNLGEVDDDACWNDTFEDDGTDALSLAAGTTKRVAITAGETDKAELLELLPIGRSEDGAERRVALQLRPATCRTSPPAIVSSCRPSCRSPHAATSVT